MSLKEIESTTSKILVTGASGFVGQHLCRLLNKHGYRVCRSNRHDDGSSVESISLDLSAAQWDKNPCEGMDVVFHLAAKVHIVNESMHDRDSYTLINRIGTEKLLDAAKDAGVKKFIFFSSVAAVDVNYADGFQQDESYLAPASTAYGQSKYEAEQLVLHGGYVPHPVVIRPCMVYGNTDKGNLPRMIKAVRSGLFPALPEVHNKRSMVHVDDVVGAALLAAERPEAVGQVYIVSDGLPYSTREIYDWIREALGKSPSSHSIPLALMRVLAKTGDGIGRLRGRRFFFDSDALDKLIGSAWYSSAKIERELDFKPLHDLPHTLPEIVRYLGL